MVYKLIGFFLFFILLCSTSLAQTADTTTTSGSGDFIDITTEVSIEIDKPRVDVFANRIKPQFSDVDLDKSFMTELLEKSTTKALSDENAEEIIKIDIDKLVNRKR